MAADAKSLLQEHCSKTPSRKLPAPASDPGRQGRRRPRRPRPAAVFRKPRVDGRQCQLRALPCADKRASDGLPKAIGVFGKENPRNAPIDLQRRAEFQAALARRSRNRSKIRRKNRCLGAASFGNPDHATAMGKLKAIPAYADAFAKAFPDDKEPISPKNWGVAIAAFERTLLTPSKGSTPSSPATLRRFRRSNRPGLRKFIDLGCAACHNGAGVGGNSFQKFGVVIDYWKETGRAAARQGPRRGDKERRRPLCLQGLRACAMSAKRRPISTTARSTI